MHQQNKGKASLCLVQNTFYDVVEVPLNTLTRKAFGLRRALSDSGIIGVQEGAVSDALTRGIGAWPEFRGDSRSGGVASQQEVSRTPSPASTSFGSAVSDDTFGSVDSLPWNGNPNNEGASSGSPASAADLASQGSNEGPGDGKLNGGMFPIDEQTVPTDPQFGIQDQHGIPEVQTGAGPDGCDGPQLGLSIGSWRHYMGKCLPCAHSWRRAGCKEGVKCTRCHICDASAWRKYRQRYRQYARQSRREQRRIRTNASSGADESAATTTTNSGDTVRP